MGNVRNPSIGPIATAVPSWKLYDNPFYYYHHHHHHHHHLLHHHHQQHASFPTGDLYNHTHLHLSARKLAASLWYLATLFRPMETGGGGGGCGASELHLARARMRELKAELELERRLRKKAEALCKALAREAAEERARRAAAEREAAELRAAVEEERRMMRVAEALREERVHMKLAEARLLMEEKLREMRCSSPTAAMTAAGDGPRPNSAAEARAPSFTAAGDDSVAGSAAGRDGSGGPGAPQRREVENPHVRRGIKGFVEFPKAGRIRSSSTSGPRDGKGGPGPKLECQRAQLRVLLRHRIPVGLASSGPVNLVM